MINANLLTRASCSASFVGGFIHKSVKNEKEDFHSSVLQGQLFGYQQSNLAAFVVLRENSQLQEDIISSTSQQSSAALGQTSRVKA